MASYERDYSRDGERRPSGPSLPPVTKWLLISNIAIFILDLLFDRGLAEWGAFAVASAFGEGRIYELLTFQFIHATLGHVAMNCIGIYLFGPIAERWWGTRPFLGFYLICGVAGALFFTLLQGVGLLPKASIYTGLVGASAGVFGLVFAVYRIAPDIRVRLLIPPVELSMRTLALVFGGLAVLTVAIGWFVPRGLNEGGEAGHLGGALMGLLLMKFPWLVGKGRRPGTSPKKIVRPKSFKRTQERKIKPRSKIDPRAVTEVDRILDKVSEQGFQSLTEAEKKVLQEASKKS